jgi:hypothetical protein
MKKSDTLAVVSCVAIEQLPDFSPVDQPVFFAKIGRLSLVTGLMHVMLLAVSFGQTNSALTAVVALTPSDVWAVGDRNTVSSRGIFLAAPLAEHWDGTKWTVIPTPDPQGQCNTFSALAASASNDVWAVGKVYMNAGNCGKGSNFPAVIEHWDGTSWNIVPSPSPVNKRLTGVAAIASNDVWAVGYNEPSWGSLYTLTEHWDGSRWKVIRSPNIQSQQTYFEAVTAVATNDVWAVGAYLKSPSNVAAPFAEHWDGVAWKIVQVPDSGSGFSFLFGASSAGTNDVWATGATDLALRWDGSNWISYPVPNTNGGLYGAVVFPDGRAWAVGYESKGGVALTLTERWDGKAWKRVPSPSPSGTNNYFNAVSGNSHSDVWAVGQYGLTNTNTLIEHWDGTAWAVVPSP